MYKLYTLTHEISFHAVDIFSIINFLRSYSGKLIFQDSKKYVVKNMN